MRSPCKPSSESSAADERRLKILLFCDASNFHRCLAEGLRRKGHEVTVASDGNRWMDTERDIDLARPFDNRLGGALLWLKLQHLLVSRLRGFDIVSISNPTFPFLRPERMCMVLKWLRDHNSNLFVNALGPDSLYVGACRGGEAPLRYSEWFVDGKPTDFNIRMSRQHDRWGDKPLKDLYEALYRSSRGTTAILYEYDVIWKTFLQSEDVGYTGIPIDTRSVTPVEIPDKIDRVRLFLGMKREHVLEKGTDRLLAAAKRVAERYPDLCALEVVENVPYKEYLARQRASHVVIDQLYSFTPATNALQAMAAGLNTLSGGEPEFYDFIGERELRPVINAVPDDEALYETLVDVVTHPEEIRKRGLQGREFVKRHNDVDIIAGRYLEFWKSRMGKPLQRLKCEI